MFPPVNPVKSHANATIAPVIAQLNANGVVATAALLPLVSVAQLKLPKLMSNGLVIPVLWNALLPMDVSDVAPIRFKNPSDAQP